MEKSSFSSHMLLSPYYDPIYDMYIFLKEITPYCTLLRVLLLFKFYFGCGYDCVFLGCLITLDLHLALAGREYISRQWNIDTSLEGTQDG